MVWLKVFSRREWTFTLMVWNSVLRSCWPKLLYLSDFSICS